MKSNWYYFVRFDVKGKMWDDNYSNKLFDPEKR